LKADRPRVLVVDDDHQTREMLMEALSTHGYQVTTAENGELALDLVRRQLFDAALLDIRMPGMSGLDLLREIRRHDPTIKAMMITGYPEISTAVEALKEGACDYLVKPFDLVELYRRLGHLKDRHPLRHEAESQQNRIQDDVPLRALVGASPEMQRVKEVITSVAATDSPVLIEGESGTGKELAASAIHQFSARGKGPFIPVNCSAIPPDLLESELFGHVRGAFSGAVADALGLFRSATGGTLFLDEVAELSPELQVKLLRFLQDKEIRPLGSHRRYTVDVRIIAATNRNVDEALRQGRLREDLFYRINVVRIVMPPLRERKSDIPALVTHFLRQFNLRFGHTIQGISPEALSVLMEYDFPGNVRELEHLLERAYALGARTEITFSDLPALPASPLEFPPINRLPTLAEAERALVFRALQVSGNNKEEAARVLGLSRRTLYRRLKEYGLL
jgi:DNA-binding NtrC family response regulator